MQIYLQKYYQCLHTTRVMSLKQVAHIARDVGYTSNSNELRAVLMPDKLHTFQMSPVLLLF